MNSKKHLSDEELFEIAKESAKNTERIIEWDKDNNQIILTNKKGVKSTISFALLRAL